ncbi:hypothetical protein XELAEV_18027544mg [Xenopus laevis]|uniref:Helix-turn-helix domain-containing protein n=1 Tax=Xenopus laevis TaxID=8355 RepID=A0A974CXY2_XENLA|nr:hypothetical protein XELAEV_18027544mg [Xenopus laevis]
MGEANASHKTIKFTFTPTELNFLDVKISLGKGKIHTDLNRKSIDKKNLLHDSSFQNPKVKSAIPMGQFMRAKRISSRPQSYTEVIITLTDCFLEKGYRSELNKAIKEVEILPLRPAIWSSIQTATPILLKGLLCPSDTRLKSNKFKGKPKHGTYPCFGCNCCSSIIKGPRINHPTKGNVINIKCHATCNSIYVVYLLKCPCGMGYVGQTKREVKKRIQEHRGWCVLEEIGIDRRGGDRHKRLLQDERKWIKWLNTLVPEGLKDFWSLFYKLQ